MKAQMSKWLILATVLISPIFVASGLEAKTDGSTQTYTYDNDQLAGIGGISFEYYTTSIIILGEVIFEDGFEAPNRIPVADAGPDQTATAGATIILNGSSSTDPDGDQLTYLWELDSKPATSTTLLSNPTTVAPELTPDLPGTYVVSLMVSDGELQSTPDTVMLIIKAFIDFDGDGVEDSLDCEPQDSTAYPGADELCANQVDEDCSGIIDDADLDDDGFIDNACGGDDIDDNNAKVSPAAPEVCNDEIDNNGDGLIDSQDPSCLPGCDVDGDGYASIQCGGPDVVDTEAGIFPGADELCDDFVDNNLNGLIDEECYNGQPTLGPPGVEMISGDSRIFLVLLDARIDTATNWEYTVNGINLGGPSVGTITPNPVIQGQFRFTAPDVTETTIFTLTAVDPDNAIRRTSVTVTVHPLTGNLELQPFRAEVGLRRSVTFTPSYVIDGVGIFPVGTAYWYVNNLLGGGLDPATNTELGSITVDGVYTAPARLPATLPFSLTVGFSLSKGQLPLVESTILITELTAIPSVMNGNDPAVPIGLISGTLKRSDDTVAILMAADMVFATNDPAVATVANGQVSVGPSLGKTTILASDKTSGATDPVTVNSRTDVDLSVEVLKQSRGHARIKYEPTGDAEIEYTCPRARFEVRPTVSRHRGNQAGNKMSGRMSGLVDFTVDETNILSYVPPDSVPQATGILGVLRKDTGVVRMGDEPGTSIITVGYDDSFNQHSVGLTTIYSRPDITVSAAGRRSGEVEPFLTEEVVVTLNTVNNGGFSDFVGELPITVELLDSTGQPEEMEVWYRNSPFSGLAWGADNPLNLNSVTSAMDFTFASTEDELDGIFFGGQIIFRFMANTPGLHTLRIKNRCDSKAPLVEHPLNIRLPRLSRRYRNVDVDPATPWVKGSWMNIHHSHPDESERVSIYDLYSRDSVESFLRNDTPRWTIIDDLGTAVSFPVADDELINNGTFAGSGGTFAFTPEEAGSYTVNMAFTDHAHLHTADLALNINEPTDVNGVAIKPQIDDWEGAISPTNTLGAIQIMGPSNETNWVLNQAFNLTVQTYPVEGMLPKAIGRTVFTQFLDSDGELILETTVTTVVGVDVWSATHDVQVDGDIFPGTADGLITLTVTVIDGPPEEDLILNIVPVITTLRDDESVPGLPLETRIQKGAIKVRTPTDGFGFAIADFEDAQLNRPYIEQYLLVVGRGLSFQPRQVPITSARVVKAVTDGRLPDGGDTVIFHAEGASRGFTTAIGAGVSTGSVTGLPAGAVVESVTVDEGRLKFTMDTTAVDPALVGVHEVTVRLNDGQDWKGPLQLMVVTLDHPEDHDNEHIPLNGNHHQMHPQGTNMIISKEFSSSDPGMPNAVTLHLVPSLKPGGPEFRGQPVDMPIIGWRREEDANRRLTVSTLKQKWLVQRNNFVIVYGNINDEMTFEPTSESLIKEEGPDSLPDFVSKEADGETVAVSIQGNYLDAMYFSAFNFVAEAVQDDVAKVPEVDFETLKDGSIHDTYSNYYSAKPGRAFDGADGSIASVSVDTETDVSTIKCDAGDCVLSPFKHIRNWLGRTSPMAYHGGILDQYYLAELRGDAWRNPPGRFYSPLGQDGRVGAFDGLQDQQGRCSDPTSASGIKRLCFGIELDGVLYDPTLVLADEDPNDPDFLTIPLVTDDIARYNPTGYSEGLGLYPDIGGTSGGHFELETGTERRRYPGSHFVVSRTPGQLFPGLYAGYPIQGSPNDLVSPYFETVKDDIENAALKRDWPVGPITGEKDPNFQFFDDRRRIMTFGSNTDKKAPISTSLTRSFSYEVKTDPPGVNDIKFRAALRVEELPRDMDQALDLVVNTMSDGAEGIIKLGYDTTIDIIADIITAVALNAVTAGSASACTYDSLKGTALNAVKGAVEKFTVDALGQSLHSQDYFGIEGTSLYGRRRTPMLTFKAIDPDLLGGTLPVSLGALGQARKLLSKADSGSQLFSSVQGTFQDLSLCKILGLPFSKAADIVKNLVSEEALGGGGAARATATKILAVHIPPEATRDPDGVQVAWFQMDQGIMITPDEENVYETWMVPPAIFTDYGYQMTLRDLYLTATATMDRNPPPAPVHSAAKLVVDRLFSPNWVLKRSPDPSAATSDFIDIYEDYRITAAMIPSIGATVTPNGTVADFKMTTGTTKIPVTYSSIVTALRSNHNAGAFATIRSNGFNMTLVGAVIPGPYDP